MTATENNQLEMNADPDMQERVDAFNKELQPILGKYELGLAALPVFTPDGRVGANPVIISVRQKKEPEAEPAKLSE